MTRRSYAGGAVQALLDGAITSTSNTISCDSLDGWPSGSEGPGPFYALIDKDVVGSEEKVLCSARTGNVLTVITRGADGTTARSHSLGATIEHIHAAVDSDEANAHVNSAQGVHGLDPGDPVVGETTAATLVNKTIDTSVNSVTVNQSDVTGLVADQTTQNNRLTTNEADIDANTAAIAQEVADRTAADSVLQTNINNEASTRSAADTAIAQTVTDLTNDTVSLTETSRNIIRPGGGEPGFPQLDIGSSSTGGMMIRTTSNGVDLKNSGVYVVNTGAGSSEGSLRFRHYTDAGATIDPPPLDLKRDGSAVVGNDLTVKGTPTVESASADLRLHRTDNAANLKHVRFIVTTGGDLLIDFFNDDRTTQRNGNFVFRGGSAGTSDVVIAPTGDVSLEAGVLKVLSSSAGPIRTPAIAGAPGGFTYYYAYIRSDGLFYKGVAVSSAEAAKRDIQRGVTDLPDVSEFPAQLTRFRYKAEVEGDPDNEHQPADPNAKTHVGFIADDVAGTAFDEFVVYDPEGNVQDLDYQRLSAYLLHEVQKLSARVTELEAR